MRVVCRKSRYKDLSKDSNSLLTHLPNVARIPQAAQMVKQGPTAPTLASTDFGETKIPEPIIVPTIIQIPLMRPTLK